MRKLLNGYYLNGRIYPDQREGLEETVNYYVVRLSTRVLMDDYKGPIEYRNPDPVSGWWYATIDLGFRRIK